MPLTPSPTRPGKLPLAGTRALAILRTVTSTRAHGYLRDFTTALEPWKTDPAVRDFVERARGAYSRVPAS